MTDEANTPAEAGTGRLSEAQAVDAIAGILSSEAPARPDKRREEEQASADDEATPQDAEEGETEADPEEDTGEDETEDGAEEAQDEDEDEQSDKDSAYVDRSAKVKLEDGSEATVDELVKGNLRQADYTRKTQELSTRYRELDGRAQGLAQFEHGVLERLQLAQNIIEASIPQPPDPRLEQDDPVAFLQAERAYQRTLQAHQELQAATAFTMQGYNAQREQARADMMRQGQEALLQMMPDLREPAKAQAFGVEVIGTLQDVGFQNPGELLSRIADPRFYRLMALAAEGRKLAKSKPVVAKKRADKQPMQPGKRQSAAERKGTRFDQKFARAKKSGRGEDWADVIADVI